MLLQLRDYIQREHVVSIQQLTREFHVDESALRPMLELWVQKGAILPHQHQKACQSACSRCSTSAVVFYQSQN
jgi:hypothetical protein